MLEPVGARLPVKPMQGAQIAQHDLQFNPQVTVVTVGTPVMFPNQDTVKHHVYSYSAGQDLPDQALRRRAAHAHRVRQARRRRARLQHPRRHDRVGGRHRHAAVGPQRGRRPRARGRRAARQLPDARVAFLAGRDHAAAAAAAHGRRGRRRPARQARRGRDSRSDSAPTAAGAGSLAARIALVFLVLLLAVQVVSFAALRFSLSSHRRTTSCPNA